MEWADFRVDEVVVHYVPTKRGAEETDEPEELFLADVAIELDAPLQTYFRDKIAGRLEAKGMEILADPGEQNQTVPEAVGAVLSQPNAFVERSQAMATHLHAVQSGVNSSGLLAVARGHTGDVPCVAIIKLEPERGVRYAIDTTDGRRRVNLELLRNLTLTDKTKVYKTALLFEEDRGITGWAADDQRTTTTSVQVASFFLSRFLGCAPKLPAAITTYDFVQAASTSFNTDVTSPKQRSRYQVALLSTMQDNTTTITPSAFASQHLDPGDRQPFLARVEAAGITPTATFVKDTSRVNVERFTMTFTSGNLTLVGDRDALDSTVEIPDDRTPDAPVQLHTRVDDIITGK